MQTRIDVLTKKITLLNETILNSMAQESDKEIIKDFTETGIKILEADFGFTWWKFSEQEEYKLAYKSPTTPYDPPLPRKDGGHAKARKSRKPFFDSNVKKENYVFDFSPYLKSYIIVPISHGNYLYGGLTFCYKEQRNFTKEELTLAEAIGSATAQSITIHKLAENEKGRYKKEMLLKETEALLYQEKLKMEFIGNATHELRTPLAIIKGNVDLAIGNKNKDQKLPNNTLRAIDYEVKHLSNILSDLTLITLPKEQLKNEVKEEKVNLKNLITDSIKRCSVLARKKNITITTQKIPNIIILGNQAYLEKMFINLLANSIIYGNNGGLTSIGMVKVKGLVTINISDNGIGISKEDLPHIFERFYRADKSHNSAEKSTGLGLAIVKWIVEIHGGTITAISTKGKGSAFKVSLPVKV